MTAEHCLQVFLCVVYTLPKFTYQKPLPLDFRDIMADLDTFRPTTTLHPINWIVKRTGTMDPETRDKLKSAHRFNWKDGYDEFFEWWFYEQRDIKRRVMRIEGIPRLSTTPDYDAMEYLPTPYKIPRERKIYFHFVNKIESLFNITRSPYITLT